MASVTAGLMCAPEMPPATYTPIVTPMPHAQWTDCAPAVNGVSTVWATTPTPKMIRVKVPSISAESSPSRVSRFIEQHASLRAACVRRCRTAFAALGTHTGTVSREDKEGMASRASARTQWLGAATRNGSGGRARARRRTPAAASNRAAVGGGDQRPGRLQEGGVRPGEADPLAGGGAQHVDQLGGDLLRLGAADLEDVGDHPLGTDPGAVAAQQPLGGRARRDR